MANILTPVSLWKNFDATLDLSPVIFGVKKDGGVKYEYVNFLGRDTGEGRVNIFAVYAQPTGGKQTGGALLIVPDTDKTVDEKLIKFFCDSGYSVLMPDLRGKWKDAPHYTAYPDNISYANLAECERHKDFVDTTADKTSWYEWVAVCAYARKYLAMKSGFENIGAIGIRGGGEVVWKLITIADFACAVTVNAAGWKTYAGIGKFDNCEPALDDERYRYMAGIDSQGYAPYVRCPVLMLCSASDGEFDYDRAFDTFSRINGDYAEESAITYSFRTGSCIGAKSCKDMIMYLDSRVKQRQVFIPAPAEITVTVDEDSNLIAHTEFDVRGDVEKFGVYFAEDTLNSAERDWTEAEYKGRISQSEHEFYLNVYEKTTILFALCYVVYKNGFTSWSKVAVKRLSGTFKNSRTACKVLYSDEYGNDCFITADCKSAAIASIFAPNASALPRLVKADKGVAGITSDYGLATYRMNAPRYAPDEDSVLKFDVCPENDCAINISVVCADDGQTYYCKQNVLGGVWQSIILPSKTFKTEQGIPLQTYRKRILFRINGEKPFALNNMLWL